MNNNVLSEIFKALSDENRIIILKLLSAKEMNAGQILSKLNITQPTLSHHMKILCDCELITSRKNGKWTLYSVNEKIISSVSSILMDIAKNEDSVGQIKFSIEASKSDLPSHLL